MSALNPITNAQVLALDPALEPEHRMQSLWHLWLKKYFSGTPFTTRAGETTEEKSFMDCVILWQQDTMPEAPGKPIIHVAFGEPGMTRQDMSEGTYGHANRWEISIFVKVAPNLTSGPYAGKDPDHVARRVAGQIEWLLSSSEREALSEAGIWETRIEQPARILPGTSWNMRMLMASCLTQRSQSK